MTSMPPKPPPLNELPHHRHVPGLGVPRALLDSLRSRIVSGLILALPIALTFWIVYQLYLTFNNVILEPSSYAVRYLLKFRPDYNPNGIWERYVSPVIAIGLVFGLLYILGLMARSGFRRAFDWILFHVPIITTIYKALSNIFESLEAQRHGSAFQRVVLVDFPHPGMKALAFVTKTLAETTTGRPILCVCVLTGVIPPAGFTLYVPEDQVTNLDWSVDQALQAILSGGITTPTVIPYFGGIDVPPTGPIVGPTGRPIESEPIGVNGD